MTKEEILLQFVLDNFSNIKEILNSTNDIENFLIKLKLDKNLEIGIILEKTKKLVDSLYDHSVKFKQEFYKHFEQLENASREKELNIENHKNATEENRLNAIETLNSQSGLEEVKKTDINKSVHIDKAKSKDDSIENENTVISDEQGDIESIIVDDKGNKVIESSVEQNEEHNIDDVLNDASQESLSEDPLKIVEVSDAIDNILDHNTENVETLQINDSESLTENPLKETEVSEGIGNILDNTENVGNGDDIAQKRNSSESSSSEEPLSGRVSSDKITTNILDDSERNDNTKKSLIGQEDKNSEYPIHLKQEPKALIRLVDLSKLIDPKPKKSVKFDNMVIILTSSDEESKTPKKKSDVKDGKLKSALKNSPSDVKVKSKNNKQTSGKQRRDSDSEQYEGESLECGVVETSKKSTDKYDKVSKNKHKSKRDVENSDSAEESEKEVLKKQSLRSRQTKHSDNNSSDSDESDTENKKSYEKSEHSSRRSSRIDKKQIMKEKTRENLRKVFKRKSTKFGKSNFEIINNSKSKDDNDVDSDSNNTIKRKSFNRKQDLIELSDTSSLSDLSDAENKDGKLIHKSKNKRKYKVDNPTNIRTDKKFTYEVYIPLPRIECSQLKNVYLKNKEILEIKSLTKIPKSSKRSRATNSDSKSSSDTEKPKSKKSKTNSPKDKGSSEEDQTSADDSIDKIVDVDKDINKNISEKKDLKDKDEQMVDIIMDQLQVYKETSEAADDDSEKEENGTSFPEERKDTGEEQKNKSDEDKNSEDEKESSKGELDDSNEEKDKTDKLEEEKPEPENTVLTDTDVDKGNEEKENSESDSNSDIQKKRAKKKWRKDKLLTGKISSSDSEVEFVKYSKKKEKSREETSDAEISSSGIKIRKNKKKGKRITVLSDSEDSDKEKDDNSSDSESDKKSNSDDDDHEKEEQKKTRKRIKRTKDSSSSDDDKSTRKQIRRLIGKDSLSDSTKQAEAEEKERKARIAEKQRKYNKFFNAASDSKVEKVVLDYDEKNKKELLSVHKGLVKKLKPHQASGIQFMWDACFESIERTKSTKGSGCILAHCMGLGKTLQVIALAHTLLMNSEKTGVTKIMVVCPLNTVLNWKAEFNKWLPKDDIEVYELVSCKKQYERQYVVQEWHTEGGVFIIGYNMFRTLSNPDNKKLSRKQRNTFKEGLLDPGPDLVVCDEGHLLKNEKTNLSIAMNRITTARRIVLTGTPLQNNLKEYWCMVQFIKPNLLGTYKEYLNRFVNPIINGQYTDSTQHDIVLMRKRSHVLHKLLDGVVQRRDYAVLEPYLPPKHEYVLFVSLTETQVKLYRHYMERFARQNNEGTSRTSFLFTDFQCLQRICTHPRVLLDKSNELKEKGWVDSEDSEGSLKDFIDDGENSDSSSTSSSSSKSHSDSDNSNNGKKKSKSQQKVRVTRALAAQRKENNEESDLEVIEEIRKEWYQEYCDGDELDNVNNSGKLFLLFQILKECEEIGDKVLVFSQSLYTLNCIEYFLDKIDEATQKGDTEKTGGHAGSWAIGLDYFRLDGSSTCDNRATWCDMFNNPSNIRARLFLISTKAGGLGINLVAANRVIIFDVSWNPSHDVQSIYRVYRFGQTKPCYIYRFVAYGTMEMKVYERQVTKQAISKRVIDEQQIDRHYNQNDLQELYKCDLEPTDRPIPLVPQDVLLGEILQKYEKTIFKYHLHQSLLENKEDEGLNEEERKAAWEEFENEKVLRKNTGPVFGNINSSIINAQAIEAALCSIVKKDNPTWHDVQIKGILPALVQQLQVQLSEGDTSMYARVQQEIQLMRALQAQKAREQYYQQQVMRVIQQQEQQAKMLGNMNINPALFNTQASVLNNLLRQRQGGPSSAPSRPLSNDVIDLND